MIEWTTALSLSGRVAKLGYDQRNLIQRYWTLAKAKLDIGATQIVVTGHSGAGKSILTAQLHGSARSLYYEAPKESLNTEVEAVTLGEWAKLVRVLPGQKARRVKGEIEAFQNNASLEGVIHVVDFGYVSPRDPIAIDALINHDKIITLHDLRARNLRLEIADLNDLLNDLRKLYNQNKRPKWLLVVVNKVDLYPNERKNALMHYHPNGEGEFSKALAKFQHEIGIQNMPIYIAEVCAHELDFMWNGSVFKSDLARQQQNAMLKSLAETLATITAIHQ